MTLDRAAPPGNTKNPAAQAIRLRHALLEQVGNGTITPVASTAQPAVRRCTSSL
nr:hypothetical protein [Rhodoferax sp.]